MNPVLPLVLRGRSSAPFKISLFSRSQRLAGNAILSLWLRAHSIGQSRSQSEFEHTWSQSLQVWFPAGVWEPELMGQNFCRLLLVLP